LSGNLIALNPGPAIGSALGIILRFSLFRSFSDFSMRLGTATNISLVGTFRVDGWSGPEFENRFWNSEEGPSRLGELLI